MCLSLDIERSEGCIADPTLLKIKNIIPSFMSSDAFLDSSTFTLKKDETAHGGFSGNPLKDAPALAHRQTQISPYLWSHVHTLLLLSTLDVMGFSSSQQFAIPFKVLLKVLEDAREKPSERNNLILKLVLETC